MISLLVDVLSEFEARLLAPEIPEEPTPHSPRSAVIARGHAARWRRAVDPIPPRLVRGTGRTRPPFAPPSGEKNGGRDG
jgi:hypothetical protein